MRELASKNPSKVMSILAERLAIERATIRLYDGVLKKVSAAADPKVRGIAAQIRRFRGEEQEHAGWLEAQIRDLGGDPGARPEGSRLAEMETEGIERAVLEAETDVTHAFQALLAVELLDHAGWDVLVDLADEADDGDAMRAFCWRSREEQEHVGFLRSAIERLARRDVLGEELRAPEIPPPSM